MDEEDGSGQRKASSEDAHAKLRPVRPSNAMWFMSSCCRGEHVGWTPPAYGDTEQRQYSSRRRPTYPEMKKVNVAAAALRANGLLLLRRSAGAGPPLALALPLPLATTWSSVPLMSVSLIASMWRNRSAGTFSPLDLATAVIWARRSFCFLLGRVSGR